MKSCSPMRTSMRYFSTPVPVGHVSFTLTGEVASAENPSVREPEAGVGPKGVRLVTELQARERAVRNVNTDSRFLFIFPLNQAYICALILGTAPNRQFQFVCSTLILNRNTRPNARASRPHCAARPYSTGARS